MGQSVCRNRQSVSSPEGAYERAYNLCCQAVTMEKMSTVYIGEALNSLKRRGDFGSWIHKLFHRKKVTIHLHYYERLLHIVEEQTASNRRKIDQIDEMLRSAKGNHHAFDESDTGLSGNDRGTPAQIAPGG